MPVFTIYFYEHVILLLLVDISALSLSCMTKTLHIAHHGCDRVKYLKYSFHLFFFSKICSTYIVKIGLFSLPLA